MELEARRLYLAEGCASLFSYCMQILNLSEHAAYGRIEAARAARRFPIILDLLTEGAVNLLEAARHKSKRDVEDLVARLQPRQDVRATIRKLPERRPAAPTQEAILETHAESSPASAANPPVLASRRAEVKPLTPERYKIQFTVNRETYEKLRRAQDLLRHTIPNGDPAAIFAERWRCLSPSSREPNLRQRSTLTPLVQ